MTKSNKLKLTAEEIKEDSDDLQDDDLGRTDEVIDLDQVET
jgi:hypothetical protein